MLTKKQKKIAGMAKPKDKITGEDFKAMKKTKVSPEFKKRNDLEDTRIKAARNARKQQSKLPVEARDVTMVTKADMEDPSYLKFLREKSNRNKQTLMNKSK